MTTPASQQPGTPGADDASPTLGVGGVTSGQEGATPSHETQQETGGSGGSGMTRNQVGEELNAPDGSAGLTGAVPDPVAQGNPLGATPDPADSAMTHTARGKQDTRGAQASPDGAGLGTPETGGNQVEADLPPTVRQ